MGAEAMKDYRDPTDPRPDPRYPNRPDHPDFRLLSKVVVEADRVADLGQSFAEITGPVVDTASVTYVAEQRALRALGPCRPGDRSFVMTSAVWIDGFYAGARFQQEKAQTPDTPDEPGVQGDAGEQAAGEEA